MFITADSGTKTISGLNSNQLFYLAEGRRFTLKDRKSAFLKIECPVNGPIHTETYDNHDLRKEAEHAFSSSNLEDGVSILTSEELLANFQRTAYVCHLPSKDDHEYRFKLGSSYSFHKITAGRECTISVRLLQYFDKFVRGKGYHYADFDIDLYDLREHGGMF